MRSSYSTLMQSKYFNPAFNSAIFDGPVRIYFAQVHEAVALKLYFMIQQKLESQMVRAKEMAKASGANILVMLYPTVESFDLSFESTLIGANLKVEKWNQDMVLGVRGPVEDHDLELVIDTLQITMDHWRPEIAKISTPAVDLC